MIMNLKSKKMQLLLCLCFSLLVTSVFFVSKTEANTPSLSTYLGKGSSANHSLAINNGKVYAFGDNTYGQLGNGSTIPSNEPILVNNLSSVTSVAMGELHSLAVKNDGTVWAWGFNNNGQLGTGNTTTSYQPTKINGLTNVVAVSAGSSFSLALKSDGTVWSWGKNDKSQLGNNSTTQSLVPVQVYGLTNVKEISAGYSFSLALHHDGTISAWGNNQYGQLGDTKGGITPLTPVKVKNLTNVISISAGNNHSMALKSDGSVWHWGLNVNSFAEPEQVLNLNGVSMISAGADYSIAVKTDGTAWAWGKNSSSLGIGPVNNKVANIKTPTLISGVNNIVSIASLYSHTLVIKNDGNIWGWGSNRNGRLGDGSTNMALIPTIYPLTNVKKVESKQTTTLILKNDGTVWASGQNNWGQIGDGTYFDKLSPVQVPQLTNIIDIASGDTFSFALKSDGTVWSWGYNGNGYLGNGNTYDRNTPGQVINLTNVKSIKAGSSHGVALKNDGTVWTWGSNLNNQLGNGSSVYYVTSPVQVSGLTNVKEIVVGDRHNFAIKTDGTVWAWGYNENGQLGISNDSPGTPVQVSSLNNVLSLAAGSSHSLAIKSDGTVWSWGNNTYGQIGDGTKQNTPGSPSPIKINITNASKVFAGSNHSLVLLKDGTVMSWGYNHNGQLGNNTTNIGLLPTKITNLSGITYIDGGNPNTFAVKTDGSVYGWGNGFYGEIGDPKYAYKPSPIQSKLSLIVQSDFTAPTISLTPSTTNLTNQGVVITASISDVSQIVSQKWINSNQPISYFKTGGTNLTTPSFTAEYNGTYTVYAQDAIGNESIQTITISNIDKMPPALATISLSTTTPTKENITAYILYPNDAAVRQYKIGYNGIWSNTSGSPGITIVENNTIYARSQDIAGNWSYNSSKQITNIDKSSPLITSSISTPDPITKNVVVTSVITDQNTIPIKKWAYGIQDIAYFNGNGFNLETNNTFTVNKNGDYSIYVMDYVGNVTLKTITINKITPSDTTITKSTELRTDSLSVNLQYSTDAITKQYKIITDNNIPLNWLNWEDGQVLTLTEKSKIITRALDSYGNETINNFYINNIHPKSEGSHSSGFKHMALVTDEGIVWTWGSNSNGELGTGDNISVNKPVRNSLHGLTNVASVEAGYDFTIALKKDGTVWAFGSDSWGQLGNGDGLLQSSNIPVQVKGLKDIVDIQAGTQHALAIDKNGFVYAWGRSDSFQVKQFPNGNAAEQPYLVYGNLLTGEIAKSIAADGFNSALINFNNEALLWGANNKGQIGNGSITNVAVPTLISLNNVKLIELGSNDASMAITYDNKLYAWGNNEHGIFGDGTQQDSLIPKLISTNYVFKDLSIGSHHAIAIDQLGNSYEWGSTIGFNSLTPTQRNVSFDANYPSVKYLPSSVNSVEAGYFTTSVLVNKNPINEEDIPGVLYTYGLNEDGQLGLSDYITSDFAMSILLRVGMYD